MLLRPPGEAVALCAKRRPTFNTPIAAEAGPPGRVDTGTTVVQGHRLSLTNTGPVAATLLASVRSMGPTAPFLRRLFGRYFPPLVATGVVRLI